MEGVDVVRLLGAGGFASVYLCRRKDEPGLYALKRIPKNGLETDEQKERLEVEKHVLFRTPAGPFLSRGVDFCEDEREASILLEYVDGRPLYQCIWGYQDAKRFPENVARHFAAQIVLGLQELHALGCVHRDLKSGNILVDRQGKAHIIDFGLSKYVDATTHLARTSSRCGTPYILAPEVIEHQHVGFVADWWSFGVIMYEMVQGRPPWEYKCPPSCSLEVYYQGITSFVMGCQQDLRTCSETPCSHDLCTLIRQLLIVNPDKRLGRNGAAEVMAHRWFHDVEWNTLLSTIGTSPYDFENDFQLPHSELNEVDTELSSAESIDPEDNAKYFADF